MVKLDGGTLTVSVRGVACRQPDQTMFLLSCSFKAGGESTVNMMHHTCTAIWETGEWPDEWTELVFMPLQKKSDLKKYTNYRTIALVSYASKILLRITLE